MRVITTISLFIMSLIINVGYCDNSEVYKYSTADSERIGYCAGVFGIGTSVAAYYNKEGPLKVYAFQFGKAATAYDAISINKLKYD